MLTIIDYKAGNVRSIQHMLKKIGVKSIIFDKIEDILKTQKYESLILSTTTDNKKFIKQNLGRILNKPFLPNFLVKFIRTIFKHSKI